MVIVMLFLDLDFHFSMFHLFPPIRIFGRAIISFERQNYIRRRTDNRSTHWRIRRRTDNWSTHWRIRRRTDEIGQLTGEFVDGQTIVPNLAGRHSEEVNEEDDENNVVVCVGWPMLTITTTPVSAGNNVGS